MIAEITDLHSAIAYIRARRDLTSIQVSRAAYNKIRTEIRDMRLIKEQPRPTYGAPWGDVDRWLWDNMMAAQELADLRVLGVRVENTARTDVPGSRGTPGNVALK